MSNDTEVLTLADFLLARIAEDQAVADAEVQRLAGAARRGGKTLAARQWRECEAKRRIVERCDSVGALMPSEHLARGVLSHLAAVYADHPDYDPAWNA